MTGYKAAKVITALFLLSRIKILCASPPNHSAVANQTVTTSGDVYFDSTTKESSGENASEGDPAQNDDLTENSMGRTISVESPINGPTGRVSSSNEKTSKHPKGGIVLPAPKKEEFIWNGTFSHSSSVTPPNTGGIATPASSQPKMRLERVVCNYNVSAENRSGAAHFDIFNLKVQHCTDICYDFVSLDSFPLHKHISPDLGYWHFNLHEPTPRYAAINDHKLRSPRLSTFVTVAEGGGGDSLTFRALVSDMGLLLKFCDWAIHILRLWGFDGLAVRWPPSAGPGRLEVLLGTLRPYFDSEVRKHGRLRRRLKPLQLVVILDRNDGAWLRRYDMNMISKLVDQITLEPGTSTQNIDDVTALVQPLFYRSNTSVVGVQPLVTNGALRSKRQASARKVTSPVADRLTIDETMEVLVQAGVIRNKINMAISLIGRGFQLKDPADNGIGAPTSGPANRSDNGVPGQIYFSETCQLLASGGTLVRASSEDLSPYWYSGEHWFSFEDQQSVAQKNEYLKSQSVGGIALLSQSEDDFSGRFCGRGPFPLSREVFESSDVLSDWRVLLPWQHYCNSGEKWRAAASYVLAAMLRAVLHCLL